MSWAECIEIGHRLVRTQSFCIEQKSEWGLPQSPQSFHCQATIGGETSILDILEGKIGYNPTKSATTGID